MPTQPAKYHSYQQYSSIIMVSITYMYYISLCCLATHAWHVMYDMSVHITWHEKLLHYRVVPELLPSHSERCKCYGNTLPPMYSHYRHACVPEKPITLNMPSNGVRPPSSIRLGEPGSWRLRRLSISSPLLLTSAYIDKMLYTFLFYSKIFCTTSRTASLHALPYCDWQTHHCSVLPISSYILYVNIQYTVYTSSWASVRD